jgi:hypothetical protein
MNIRFNKSFGYLFAFAGLLDLGVFLLLLIGKGESKINLGIFALAAFYLSYVYFRGKYFEVTDKALISYSLMGTRGKEYLYQNKAEVSTDGKSIFLLKDCQPEKLPFSKIMSDGKDWNAVIAWIESDAPLA